MLKYCCFNIKTLLALVEFTFMSNSLMSISHAVTASQYVGFTLTVCFTSMTLAIKDYQVMSFSSAWFCVFWVSVACEYAV